MTHTHARSRRATWLDWLINFTAFLLATLIGEALLPAGPFGYMVWPIVAGVSVCGTALAVRRWR